jgi:hypothetical protein
MFDVRHGHWQDGCILQRVRGFGRGRAIKRALARKSA